MRFNRAGWMASLLGGAALMSGAAEVAMRRWGDADIFLDVDRAHSFTHKVIGAGYVVLGAIVPFGNRGKQQGCVLDCSGRVLPDGDRYKGLHLEVRVSNLLLPRDDGYFEAIMYKKNDNLELGIEIHARGDGDVVRRLEEVGHIGLELRFSFYMRSPLQHRRTLFTFPVARARRQSQDGGGNGKGVVPGSASVEGIVPARKRSAVIAKEKGPATERRVGVAIPIRTHILTPCDRFAEVVEKYVMPLARKGDIVAVAESALAIMQGRLYHVEEIRPRWLACRLCRIVGPDSSLSTPYGMEMAFRVCGTARLLAAMAAGVAGKLIRRDGDFYRVAGEAVATIDDASGTLAPFDKYVVLGPVDADQVVDGIKRRFGLECAVVDANDLKRVAVLAVTDRTLSKVVEGALIDNPQGNAGEQTPVVLIPQS